MALSAIDFYLFAPWVELVHLVFQEAPVEVGVNLRRRDLGVPQHFLHGPQIGTTFNQMCRKAVTEGVWADVFGCLRPQRFSSAW